MEDFKELFDKEQRKCFEKLAFLDIPDYRKSDWSENIFFGTRNFFFKLFKELKKKNLKILDVGCGPGHYCNSLYDLGNRVIGIDYSKNIIMVAKKNRKGRNIKYKVCSIYSLPFQNEVFDVVLCIGVLQSVAHTKKAVKELSRVTKKKGVLFISTLKKPSIFDLPLVFSWHVIISLMNKWFSLKKLMIIFKDNITLATTKSYFGYARKVKYYRAFGIKRLLKKAGFKKNTVYYSGLLGRFFYNKLFLKIPLGARHFFIKAEK
nr:class I SAM-dependent methyltransferase [Nanoarchaeota archaeon]